VALIVVSLILISSSFSEADSGPLHSLPAVLSPLEEVADRALKPVRDLINWFDETFDARGENDALRAEVADLREQLAEAQGAVGDNEQFRKLLELVDEAPAVGEFSRVTARVIGRSPTVWYATVSIDKGSSSGLEVNDAVVTGDGLVGRVSEVTGGTAQVELITDHRSAVSAEVLPDGPQGIVEPEVGDPDDLLFDFIEGDDAVQEGEMLSTAGWSDGEISSAYPPGIPIGSVTSAESGADGSVQDVHLRPFADLRGLEYVQVLTGGPERPGVAG
jgi:rod shape-determining protein MreC